MKKLSLITLSAAFVIAALSSGCSKSETAATPHLTVTMDVSQGSNLVIMTNNGHTFVVGRIITNGTTRTK